MIEHDHDMMRPFTILPNKGDADSDDDGAAIRRRFDDPPLKQWWETPIGETATRAVREE